HLDHRGPPPPQYSTRPGTHSTPLRAYSTRPRRPPGAVWRALDATNCALVVGSAILDTASSIDPVASSIDRSASPGRPTRIVSTRPGVVNTQTRVEYRSGRAPRSIGSRRVSIR